MGIEDIKTAKTATTSPPWGMATLGTGTTRSACGLRISVLKRELPRGLEPRGPFVESAALRQSANGGTVLVVGTSEELSIDMPHAAPDRGTLLDGDEAAGQHQVGRGFDHRPVEGQLVDVPADVCGLLELVEIAAGLQVDDGTALGTAGPVDPIDACLAVDALDLAQDRRFGKAMGKQCGRVGG